MAHQNILFGWIEAAVRYAGVFGSHEKAGYQRVFGVSAATLSRHQAGFATAFERAAGDILFARTKRGAFVSGKLAIRPEAVLPNRHVFAVPPLERWLQDAMGPRFVRPRPALRVDPDPAILRAVVQAISHQQTLMIDYLSRQGFSQRAISPHVIVDVVNRYHVRAYDHAKNRYADFILSRITAAKPTHGVAFVDAGNDYDWHDIRMIKIAAREGVYPDGVKMDFGLNANGNRHVRERAAIARYLCDAPEEGYDSPVTVCLE